jgi:hypothetical protein
LAEEQALQVKAEAQRADQGTQDLIIQDQTLQIVQVQALMTVVIPVVATTVAIPVAAALRMRLVEATPPAQCQPMKILRPFLVDH